jgi:hypothetical protein
MKNIFFEKGYTCDVGKKLLVSPDGPAMKPEEEK